MRTEKNAQRLTITELEQIRQRAEERSHAKTLVNKPDWQQELSVHDSEGTELRLVSEVETLITEKAAARRMLDELIGEMANASEAGYALAPETVREDLEKIRKELIDHGE